MAKYGMLNCWSDNNRGDLGIMIATTEEIKRFDKDAKVIALSSFVRDDSDFRESHAVLKQYVPKILPAIFGTLGLKLGSRINKSLPSKMIAIVFESIRYGLIMVLPNKASRKCLTHEECETLDELASCDILFSKGGSVFTDYNSIRGNVSLERLCRTYALLNKFDCHYYILGQSFGPIKYRFGLKATNRVIKNAEKIFLRERQCINAYPGIKLNGSNVFFSNDAGFLLEPTYYKTSLIKFKELNVGITVRGNKNDNGYVLAIVKSIKYLIDDKSAFIHIFQQVSMDSEPDNKVAQLVLSELSDEYARKVTYHTEKVLPQELCWMYGQMDFLIGTRLHSTIFAMTAGTPAIGISYHGTKTHGIFSNIGVPELVIQGKLSSGILIEKINYLMNNYDEIQVKVNKGVEKAQNEMREAIKDLVSTAQYNSMGMKY